MLVGGYLKAQSAEQQDLLGRGFQQIGARTTSLIFISASSAVICQLSCSSTAHHTLQAFACTIA
jgi:hypothetical protein